MKIDLIYTWVDGADTEWQKKRAHYQGVLHPESAVTGRYFDNEELKYSLRSVEKYAPWINHIFIVTDNQKPAWLNTRHEKITIVDHRDIIDHQYLPVFNSDVLEWFLHRIEGLSEYYLYANDDMFFGHDNTPSDFFDSEGMPIEYVMKYEEPRDNLWGRSAKATYRLAIEKTGKKPVFSPGHVIDPYRKTFVEEAFYLIWPEIEQTCHNRFRSENDIKRFFVSLYDHACGRRELVYGNRNIFESFFRTFRAVHLSGRYERNLKKLRSKKYKLFCINDVEYTTDERRIRAKAFLEEYFPEKSGFEA